MIVEIGSIVDITVWILELVVCISLITSLINVLSWV